MWRGGCSRGLSRSGGLGVVRLVVVRAISRGVRWKWVLWELKGHYNNTLKDTLTGA